MSIKALTAKLRRAIAKQQAEMKASQVPDCGLVVAGDEFDESLPEFVYQIIRADTTTESESM